MLRVSAAVGRRLGFTLALVGTACLSYWTGLTHRPRAEPISHHLVPEDRRWAPIYELASGPGGQSVALQLAIAVGLRSEGGPSVQIKAVDTLAGCGNPVVADELAKMLEPHEGLELRQAVARALRALPCPDDCNRSILHYLERIWRGELNSEDTLVLPFPGPAPEVIRNQQQAVYSDLYSVLRRDKEQTLAALRSIYGLGTRDPATFGLDLVARIRFADACPSLAESDARVKLEPPEWSRTPRKQIQMSMAALMCEVATPGAGEVPKSHQWREPQN